MRVWMLRLVFAVGVLAGAVGLWAQATGSITGTVTDKSGAVIPGATVTVTNEAQNVSHTTTTNGQGQYLVGGLSAGTYDVTVAATGFSKNQTTGIVLHIGDNLRSDAQLQVGAVTNEVTVSGSNVGAIQTQTAAMSGTITGTEVQQLELNGRNFTQLITLTPGVSNQTGQDEGTVGVYGNVAYSVNGGRTEYNNLEVDGANVMDNGSNATINVYPSIDAISHVRVLTSNYGAQYGRDASGTVEADTKSGSNGFHGDAYEFLRNESLNSRSFFDTQRPPYRKNDYGYTIGGPIVKNKTFFFWSEEWRKEKNPTNFNMQVPSADERGGNFTDVCPAAGASPAGFNDFRAAFPDCPVSSVTPPPAGSSAQPTYTQFPGNSVSIDPVAQALLPLVPTANSGSGANSFLNTSISEPTNWREELFRVDQTFNSKWSAYFRFIHDSWNTVVVPTLWGSGNIPLVQTGFVGPGVDMVAHLATTVSPTLLNEFVADYTADHIGLTDTGPIALPSGFSMPGLFKNGFGGKLPTFSLCCNATLNGGINADTGDEPWFNSNPTYGFRDQVTQVVGNHNLYYGFQFTAAQKNEMGGQEVQPSLGFNNTSPISTGNALADMFLGNISSVSQSNVQPKYYDRYKTFAPYIQDDWHVNSRLTLNLGMRIDMLGTYYDTGKVAAGVIPGTTGPQGLTYNFDPSAWAAANAPTIDANGNLAQNAAGTASFFNGLVQCGTNGVPSGCIKGHLWNWSPRFGFAYDVGGRGTTAIRGGYGIFYDHTNGNESIDQLRNPPVGLSPSVSNVSGYSNLGAGGAGTFGPLGIGAVPLQERWPYVEQWNLDVQHQFFGNTALTVAYVGSKGTHLTDLRDLNQLHPVSAGQNPYTNGATLANDCNSDTFLDGNGNPQAVMANGQSIAPTNPAWNNLWVACGNSPATLRPFVGYGGIQLVDQGANSIYHALQVSMRRSVGRLDLNLAYTWSHSIDNASDRYDGSFVNSYDLAANRGSSNFDQTHLLSMAWVYHLPLFAQNHWLGGWEWSGIMTLDTGTPFSVTNGLFGDNAGVANGSGTGSRVDVVGNPHVISGDPNAVPAADVGQILGPLLYNPAAFAEPTGLTFGNSGRNLLRNPGRANFDMGLFKSFQVTERQTVQFRAESFNTFNHTQFNGVNSGFNGYGSNVSVGTLRPGGAHLGRVIQFGLKWAF